MRPGHVRPRHAAHLVAGALAVALAAVVPASPSAASPVTVGVDARNMGATAGAVGSTADLAVRFAGLDAGQAVTFRFADQESGAVTDGTGLAQASVIVPDTASSVTWTARFAGTRSETGVSYAPAEHTGTFVVTERGLRLSAPERTRSGSPVEVTVTALTADGEVDAAATGTPVLTTTDTHQTPGSCTSYRSGTARCTSLVLRDLGAQVITAVDDDGRGGAGGGRLTVSPDGVELLAYEQRVTVGAPAEFLVEPSAAGEGLVNGYPLSAGLRASTGETGRASCPGSSCRLRLVFATLGARDVVATDERSGLVSAPVRVDVVAARPAADNTEAPSAGADSEQAVQLPRTGPLRDLLLLALAGVALVAAGGWLVVHARPRGRHAG